MMLLGYWRYPSCPSACLKPPLCCSFQPLNLSSYLWMQQGLWYHEVFPASAVHSRKGPENTPTAFVTQQRSRVRYQHRRHGMGTTGKDHYTLRYRGITRYLEGETRRDKCWKMNSCSRICLSVVVKYLVLLQKHPGERKAVHERNAVHIFLWRCLKVIQTPVHLQLIETCIEMSWSILISNSWGSIL